MSRYCQTSECDYLQYRQHKHCPKNLQKHQRGLLELSVAAAHRAPFSNKSMNFQHVSDCAKTVIVVSFESISICIAYCQIQQVIRSCCRISCRVGFCRVELSYRLPKSQLTFIASLFDRST